MLQDQQINHAGTSSRTETHKDFFIGTVLYYKDSEALKQVVHRGCEHLHIPGRVQVQTGWDSEQPGLVEDSLSMAGGVELGDLLGLFQPKLFHDSMILRCNTT